MKKLTKRKKKLILLLSLTVLLGVGSITALVEFNNNQGHLSFNGMLRADIFYIIVAFLSLIPLFLLILLLVMIFAKEPSEKENNKDADEVPALKIESGEIELNLPLGETADASSDDTITERFCMLSEIDKNSTKYGHT
ncbi:MAG: hypothetical protein ACI3X1_03315, partial [Eubacteriales bacterium]